MGYQKNIFVSVGAFYLCVQVFRVVSVEVDAVAVWPDVC